MSELEEFGLDRGVKRAWATFQTRLADHVASMADDDILIVEFGGADPKARSRTAAGTTSTSSSSARTRIGSRP